MKIFLNYFTIRRKFTTKYHRCKFIYHRYKSVAEYQRYNFGPAGILSSGGTPLQGRRGLYPVKNAAK